MNIQTMEGFLIPFLGTSLGAAMVFFLKKQISGSVQKALTGFAAGVMVAASFWSLLQPALDSSAEMGSLAFLPAAIGFLAGIGFLLGLDVITPHMHMRRDHIQPEQKTDTGQKADCRRKKCQGSHFSTAVQSGLQQAPEGGSYHDACRKAGQSFLD